MSNILSERPTDIILMGTVGSQCYGLAHADSDVDQLGIYRALFHDVLGLDGCAHVKNSWVEHEPDLTLHEVGKYLQLALACNPTILEALWLTEYTVKTLEGNLILINRKHFLSEPAVRGAYGEYAVAQAKRLMERTERGDPDPRVHKHARHCFRLLYLGQQLLTTGTMTLDVSYMRDYLWELGDLALSDPQAFYGKFVFTKERFNNLESVLPKHPNRDKIAELLPQIRLHGQREKILQNYLTATYQ